jgi:hypothetical protein
MVVSRLTEEARAELVRKKAFELYASRGGTPGHDLEDWLLAERLVAEEYGETEEAETGGKTTAGVAAATQPTASALPASAAGARPRAPEPIVPEPIVPPRQGGFLRFRAAVSGARRARPKGGS